MHSLHSSKDLDAMMTDMDNRSVIMLGEASHGTHEFYSWRTAISKRLIEEKGFNFIAVEGDWPDCYQINRYVKGYEDAGNDIREVLNKFDRWPTWMWSNWEIAALAEWMREYNSNCSEENKVGFYGLDVYSLWDSMYTLMDYLSKQDPEAAEAVKKAIRCFEPFGEDESEYAIYSLRNHGCGDQVVDLLQEIRKKVKKFDSDREAGFNTEQNALIAVNAEKYYRSMIGFDNESWNIRDRHMIETLQRLMDFHGMNAKGIVWEHNTHIGDARATDMARSGMVNTGQLAREIWGEDKVYLAGFASYEGTVIAGEQWGAPMEEMELPAARAGSIEAVLHKNVGDDGYILFSEEDNRLYGSAIHHRAIGVVYDPLREKFGNYVPSVLSRRYDALIYIDATTALHPLVLHPDPYKMPETYPFMV